MKLNDTWGQRKDPENFQTKKNTGEIKRISRTNKYKKKTNKRLFAGMQLFKTFFFMYILRKLLGFHSTNTDGYPKNKVDAKSV